MRVSRSPGKRYRSLLERRRPDADLVAGVWTWHGRSQREFAAVLGIDPDTLQNWEQCSNRLDGAVLKLIAAFDAGPEVVEAVT